MRPNVFIKAWDRGKLCYRWEGHNTWTQNGREYLASLLGLATQNPDVPVLSSHLKHMQFGIGGDNAVLIDIPADVVSAYPAGDDPNATAGNEYNHEYNIDPPISTLERPVRFAGGVNPYSTASPTDIWLSSTTPPNFLITNPALGRTSIRLFISGAAGDIVYAPLTTVPLTEAGLVVSGQADVNAPYNQVVTYVNFNTFNMTATKDAEVEWVVEF